MVLRRYFWKVSLHRTLLPQVGMTQLSLDEAFMDEALKEANKVGIPPCANFAFPDARPCVCTCTKFNLGLHAP